MLLVPLATTLFPRHPSSSAASEYEQNNSKRFASFLASAMARLKFPLLVTATIILRRLHVGLPGRGCGHGSPCPYRDRLTRIYTGQNKRLVRNSKMRTTSVDMCAGPF